MKCRSNEDCAPQQLVGQFCWHRKIGQREYCFELCVVRWRLCCQRNNNWSVTKSENERECTADSAKSEDASKFRWWSPSYCKDISQQTSCPYSSFNQLVTPKGPTCAQNMIRLSLSPHILEVRWCAKWLTDWLATYIEKVRECKNIEKKNYCGFYNIDSRRAQTGCILWPFEARGSLRIQLKRRQSAQPAGNQLAELIEEKLFCTFCINLEFTL